MPIFRVKSPLDLDGNFALSQEDLHHLTRVLRLHAGSTFSVILPDGTKAKALLEEFGKSFCGKILKKEDRADPMLPLWIGIGLVKWPRMEWLVEKATELGVTRILPLHLERCRLPACESASPHKLKRLQKIAEESLKQCERANPPEIDFVMSLEEFIQETKAISAQAQKWSFIERSMISIWNSSAIDADRLQIIAIGPEGGFAKSESERMSTAGFQPVSLGSHPFRSETAALYAACAVHNRLAATRGNS